MDPYGSNVTASAGEPYKIKIPYKGGKPKPEAKFFNGNKEIVPDDRISIEVLDDEVVLTCKSALKPDEGQIRVELKNKKGTDSTTVNLKVKDKPGAPKGPLDISDITPESCMLSWKAPEVSDRDVVWKFNKLQRQSKSLSLCHNFQTCDQANEGSAVAIAMSTWEITEFVNMRAAIHDPDIRTIRVLRSERWRQPREQLHRREEGQEVGQVDAGQQVCPRDAVRGE